MAVEQLAATVTDVWQAVRQLAPELRARAAEGDSLRTMPPDLVQRAKRAGLFRLNLPKSLGGLEIDPMTTVEIFEELSRADGSAGWTVMIGNSTAFFAWLEPRVAAEMIGGNPNFASTAAFAPEGRARPDGPGCLGVSGRWSFNSGCPHAEWLQVGVLVMDGSQPRLRPDGAPDWRFAFVPRDLVEIQDTWESGGLRATGSHHVAIVERRLPESHFAAPFFQEPSHDGALWRIPFFTQVGIYMTGFPLGVARRCLDEFDQIARGKVQSGAADTVAHDGHCHVELARAEAALQSARAFAYDVIGDVWTTACRGSAPSLDQRARVLLATTQAMRAAVEVVDRVMGLAGAGAVFLDSPLQRCFRDIHAAAQHIMYRAAREEMFAKHRLGIGQATYRF